MPSPGRRILCVDDDHDTCELIAALLGRAGFEVRRASTAAEGLSLARSETFDLYLLDQGLPGWTGSELCRRIREFDTATPVVFFSGFAHESDRRRAFDAGALEYLVKPNDVGKLVETVTRLTGGEGTAGGTGV